MGDTQQQRSDRARRLASVGAAALRRAVPGLAWMRHYDRSWLGSDVVAGITIAAVILPVAMAYGRLAGLPPVAGIYASMLPLIAYAFFGSSKRLILGPDASSAALVAAAVAPLANGSPSRYASLAAALAIETGLLCLIAGVARLGFIASFLSKPILVGYLNGLALTVIVSQAPAILGIHTSASGFFPEVGQILAEIRHTQPLTMAIGVGVLVVVWVLWRVAPGTPGPLFAVIGATLAVSIWRLDTLGVSTIGAIPTGLPSLTLPAVTASDMTHLLSDAVGIALLTFSDTVLNARAFSAGARLNANQELISLGIANSAAGLSQGFPISASGTRTAVNEAAGGKTQLVSIIAALALALMLLFLTGPLSSFPTAALGAILIVAAVRLFDMGTFRALARTDWRELLIALVTLIGVLAVGLLEGIVLAIALSLLLLLARTVRPHDAVLGEVEGVDGFQDIEEFPQGVTVPGLLVYRFDGPLFFANADYFEHRVTELVDDQNGPVEWFLLDAEAITDIDTTAADIVENVRRDLAQRGILFVVARAKQPLRARLHRIGLFDKIGKPHFYASIRSAVAAFDARERA
ncbi:MAG TPA: sulfate permease [Ktedonobacterales bacterium]|nr:sulfate permease [Ktedonobacterales bacterium]